MSFWLLLPRLVVPALLFMLSLWLTGQLRGAASKGCSRIANGAGVVVFVALLATLGAAFVPQGVIRNEVALVQDPALATENPENPADWRYFGRSENATKFAPYSDITPENVDKLQVAWTYKTGRDGRGNDANTLQQIGGVLYSCTPLNVVTALDVDTGEELWRFDPKIEPRTSHLTCRVGYYDASTDPVVASPALVQPLQDDASSVPDVAAATAPTQQPSGACVQRILLSTVDANLWALDAQTGKPCEDFGNGGVVDLKVVGMGETQNGRFYHPTAAPTVAGNLVIIGGWVMDIAPTAAPGVVRAFDARTGDLVWAFDPRTGDLVWAFDPGNPEGNRHGPAPGETYTMGTPNVWGPMSFDLDLGLVFMPTGNGPTDYWGGARTEASEKYGSAVVALDLATGENAGCSSWCTTMSGTMTRRRNRRCIRSRTSRARMCRRCSRPPSPGRSSCWIAARASRCTTSKKSPSRKRGCSKANASRPRNPSR
uniref:PQQ-binding-like beta-propeller repeat protein n=1 Tax=Lampropedia cohaerens TaxID=1610491 RepID=UPI000B1E6C08|nr:PQQ-binding-like beta-propeller repeat protein [Lampropedia cohaerens]